MQLNKTGFSFGVILGAVIGTGAIILSKSKEGQKIQKQIVNSLEKIKENYPERIQQIEDVFVSALDDAKNLTKEIKGMNLHSQNSSKTFPKKKTEESRTFKRK